MIHCGAIREAEQPLLYVVPSGRGMFVMVSLVANRYWPSAAGVPSATALAGPSVESSSARVPAAASAAAVATRSREDMRSSHHRWSGTTPQGTTVAASDCSPEFG